MYEFPYGAGQQLNLNWIINEIITLHKRLDPDWELPNFNNAFPYMNLNQLNLDWILRELKAIKELAPTEDAGLLKMVANALIANTYDAETQYNVDDIVYRDYDNRLYKCITATPAGGEPFDNSKWLEVDVGEVLTDLLVNGSGTVNAVTNVRYNNHKLEQEINGAYNDIITIEDSPTNTENRLPSSKAAYNANKRIQENRNFFNTLYPDLSGKKVSIIGDSISTYDGYLYGNYPSYYPSSNIPDVDNVNKTWWKMFLDLTGASLEVNASYSGSCVTSVRSGYPTLADRCESTILGNPDIIIIALGTNDSAESAPIGSYDYDTAINLLNEDTFANAYIKGVKKLQAAYPNADIICITLRQSNNYAVATSYIASYFNCKYVYCGSYVGAVVSHPAFAGMCQIAANVLLINPSYTGGYGIMTGSALTKGNYVLTNQNFLNETPSALRSFNRFVWQDPSANEIARLATFKTAAGKSYLQMRAHNLPSNGYNTLTLLVKDDGTPEIELEQDAWLDALQSPKIISFGIYANTPASITCTESFRGLLLFNAASSDATRYGLYLISSTSAGVFYDPIPILAASAITLSKNNKTLTITSTAACKANFLLFDRGGTLTISGNA